MKQHTHDKVYTEIDNDSSRKYLQVVTDRRVICTIGQDYYDNHTGYSYSKEQKANAARIVECWNNYDQLKADNQKQADTIKELLDMLKYSQNKICGLYNSLRSYDLNNGKKYWQDEKEAIDIIEKAIAKHNQ